MADLRNTTSFRVTLADEIRYGVASGSTSAFRNLNMGKPDHVFIMISLAVYGVYIEDATSKPTLLPSKTQKQDMVEECEVIRATAGSGPRVTVPFLFRAEKAVTRVRSDDEVAVNLTRNSQLEGNPTRGRLAAWFKCMHDAR